MPDLQWYLNNKFFCFDMACCRALIYYVLKISVRNN
jgi:hypothetical protein